MRISSSTRTTNLVSPLTQISRKTIESPRFGNRQQQEGELNIPPKTLAGIAAGVLMAFSGLFYVTNEHHKEQAKIRQQQIQTAQTTFSDEWKQTETAETQMQFIRQTLGKKLTTAGSSWFDPDENKLAEWAAEKISEVPTDRNKVRLILDGLVTNPAAILEKKQHLLAHIEDLEIKDKVNQLFTLQPSGSSFEVKIEINRTPHKDETPSARRIRELDEEYEAKRAARKAEFEKVKAELTAYALDKPKG